MGYITVAGRRVGPLKASITQPVVDAAVAGRGRAIVGWVSEIGQHSKRLLLATSEGLIPVSASGFPLRAPLIRWSAIENVHPSQRGTSKELALVSRDRSGTTDVLMLTMQSADANELMTMVAERSIQPRLSAAPPRRDDPATAGGAHRGAANTGYRPAASSAVSGSGSCTPCERDSDNHLQSYRRSVQAMCNADAPELGSAGTVNPSLLASLIAAEAVPTAPVFRPPAAAVAALESADPAVIGRYRLIGRLGAGGMGVVYLVQDSHGNRFALKSLAGGRAMEAELRTRLAREARSLNGIDSQHVVRVVDVDTDAEEPYIVMTYAEGARLDKAIPEGGLNAAAVLEYGAQLAGAVAHIHSRGIVHRDLKPHNVILGHAGVTLVDFGIASLDDEGTTALTRQGTFLGSLAWLAPEVIAGGSADERSDAFGLGLVLGYMAMGRNPYGNGRPEAVMYRIMHGDPDLQGCHPQIATTITAALAKNPNERATAAQTSSALVTCLQRQQQERDEQVSRQFESLRVRLEEQARLDLQEAHRRLEQLAQQELLDAKHRAEEKKRVELRDAQRRIEDQLHVDLKDLRSRLEEQARGLLDSAACVEAATVSS